MKTTEIHCNVREDTIAVIDEFVRYTTANVPSEVLEELVDRTPLLQDFDMTFEEFDESCAVVELNVVIAPNQDVSAYIRVKTDNIIGAGYYVPLNNDECKQWKEVIFDNVAEEEMPLMQRFLNAGYPLRDVYYDKNENSLYVYASPTTSRAIDEWCKDNNLNREQRCAPYRGTATGRMMTVCKLPSEEERQKEQEAKPEKKGFKLFGKKKKDDYER